MNFFNLPFLLLLLNDYYALSNEEIKQLCSDPDVDILELNFSNTNVTHLTKEIFENCDHLKELILIFSYWGNLQTYKIDTNAFENLNNLKMLRIGGYKIPHVKKGFFKLNPFITQIHLQSCDIEEIDPHVFEDFKDLEIITIIANSKMKHLPENIFKNLTKLTTVDLQWNRLENLTWEEFKGLTNLKVLKLNFNKISSIDVDKVAKYMPNLEVFGLQCNPIWCKGEEAFIKEIKRKINGVIEEWKDFRSCKTCQKVDPMYG